MAAKHILRGLAGGILAAAMALAQTQVDLRTQARNIDFSSALSTKPIRTGVTLPATCSAGEAYFLTTASAGQNLNLCVSANSWASQGSSGSTSPQGPNGPALGWMNASTLTIGANCSVPSPCNARVGGITYTYAGSSTIILSSGTPSVRVYISDGSDGAAPGTVKVRNSAVNGVACSGGCVVENAQTGFPGMSIPLGIWTATYAAAWDATGQDLRAALTTTQMPGAGSGILITTGASTSIAVDTSVIPQKFTGSGIPGNVTKSAVGDFYTDVVNNDTYQCFRSGPCSAVGTGNWVKIVAGSGTLDTTGVAKKYSGLGAPQTVAGSSLGDLYSDVTNSDTYQCFGAGPCTGAGAGNWVRIDSGTGVTPAPTLGGMYASYGGLNYYPLSISNGLPDATAFTWLNQPGGATETPAGGHAIHMNVPIGSATFNNNLAVLQDPTSLSNSSFTVQGTLTGCAIPSVLNGSLCAIGVTDGTRVVSFGSTYIYAVFAISVVKWSDVHTWNGPEATLNTPLMQNTALKIVLNGGNLTFYYSVDGGASYDSVLSESVTNFFPSASGLKGVWMINNNYSQALSAATLTDWKVR